VSAEIWPGSVRVPSLSWRDKAGGQRAVAGQTEAEDDWADRHVRQDSIGEPSLADQGSGSVSMQSRE